MRSEFYHEVREATRDEFDLLGQLGSGEAWAVFLGRARDGGALALLLLQEAEDGGGEYDLEVIQALEAGLPVGRTTCGACGTGEAGWPRFCSGCGADLSGVQADGAVPGGSAAELLEEVCGAAEGEYRVLGALPHAEGGGALYFAREENTDRLVGLALREDAGGELDLVVSWTAETAAADVVAPTSRPTPPEPFVDREEVEREPIVLREEAGPVPPPLWDPPSGRERGRSRERTRRLAAGAAIASVAVALVAAVVWAITGPGAGGSPDAATNGMARGPAVTAPADSAATGMADSTGAPHTPSGDPTADRGARTELPDPPATRPRPATATAGSTVPATQPGGQTVATAPTLSPPDDKPTESAPPTADGVEAAVRRYAQAVGSCQTSRISRAYPGITPAEMERWENFFRLNCNAGVQAGFVAESGPTVDGDRAELLFTLTLAYVGATGNQVRQPLPMRAVLHWRQGAWTVQEVRSLGAR